jgi:hypothetical protein
MKLRLVKFAEYMGPDQTRSFGEDKYDLRYEPEHRAIRVESRVTGVVFFADQTGAAWYPLEGVAGEPAACATCGDPTHATNSHGRPVPPSGTVRAAASQRLQSDLEGIAKAAEREIRGGPATPVARQPTPGPQRPKR